MNEMNPRMKRKSPLPFTKLCGALSGFSQRHSFDYVVTTDFHHETDRICRRHPRDLHKAGRVRGQEAKSVALSSSSLLRLKSSFFFNSLE